MPEGKGVELFTPTLVSDQPFCLSFWYYIKDSNEFRLDITHGGNKNTLWEKPKGTTMVPWTEAKIDIPAQEEPFKVRITDHKISQLLPKCLYLLRIR